MKRIILIAAACAALASCTKAETETVNVTEPVGGTSFEKGQTVTLTVSTPGQTKATSALNSETGEVTFKWEQTDAIKVTVGSESATFTVSKLIDGGASAEFIGTMPASGASFDVQYPVTDPDLSSQTYVAGGLPQNMMKFTATGCTTSVPFELESQYSALRLNLYGSKPIGKIVVSDGAESPKTYTLTCGEPGKGITPGTTADTATPFFIVVPARSMQFTAEVFDNGATPAAKPTNALDGLFTVAAGYSIFTPSQAQTFKVGEVLNMPSKEVIFPTKVRFSQGNLQATYNSSTSSYSWDFAANQYDCIASNAGNTSIDSQSNGAKVDLFGWSTPATYYGINTSDAYSTYSGDFKDWGTAIDDKGTWRTLTSAEWQYLFDFRDYSNETRKGLYAYGVTVAGKTNCVVLYPDGFKGTKVSNGDQSSYATAEGWSSAAAAGFVCLPAAGNREGSSVNDVGKRGAYWSSTACEVDGAHTLRFYSYSVVPGGNANRNVGYSVRLVSAAN